MTIFSPLKVIDVVSSHVPAVADPVVRGQAADIQGFAGGLFKTGSAEWSILYNESLTSPGRIRFTKAHELGALHAAPRGAGRIRM